MPGSRPITLHYRASSKVGEREDEWWSFEVRCRPKSLWRLMPGLGPLIMFRNGALVTFRLDFQLIEQGSLAENRPSRSVTFNIDIEGKNIGASYRSGFVGFVMPLKRHNTHAYSDSHFLNGQGHAEVKVSSETIYVFDVWEPAYSIVNWGMLLLAAGLGGLVGFLLAGLVGDFGGQ